MITRKHIIFHGSVQGVGFRWRARHAADLYGCTGWVHNKWDGTVEREPLRRSRICMRRPTCRRTNVRGRFPREIQGEEEQIDRVIQSVNSGRYVFIERMDVKTIPVEEERSFRTR